MKRYFKMLWRIILYFGTYYLSQIICSFFVGIILVAAYHVADRDKMTELVNRNMYMILIPAGIIAVLIYIFMLRGKEESFKERCSFKKIEGAVTRNTIFLALSLGCFSTSLIYLTQNIFKDYTNVSRTFAASLTSFVGIITLIVFVPIVEEILFRALIFKELKANVGLTAGLIIQALLFALAHGNILQGIYTFILGILAGLVYYWTKSIYSNITLHLTFNLAGSFIFPILIYFTKAFAPVYMIIGIVSAGFFTYKLYKHRNYKIIAEFGEQAKEASF